MSKAVRAVAPLAILVGSIGPLLTLAGPGEAAGPGGYGGPRGPSMPSHSQGVPTPSNLSGQRGKSAGSGSSSQSGPTTFGYWDGSRFVRTPGSWAVPANGFKAPDQRIPDQRLR